MSSSKRGPKREVSNGEILQALRDVDYPVATTRDVADRVSLAKRTVYNRLEEMKEQGRIEGRNDPEGTNYYWEPSDA